MFGWESKWGSEDICMCSLVLFVFGVSFEINIGGVGVILVLVGMDFCINVFILEFEFEKGIFCWVVVIVVMSFVCVLNIVCEVWWFLGFGLIDESCKDMVVSLDYIVVMDNDGLVWE